MNKELLFQPKQRGLLKKSPFIVVPMFSKIAVLCAKYLAGGFTKPIDVTVTDEYIQAFWRLQFEDTHTSLYATGREVLEPGRTYVFMSNHESWLDIPAIFGAVPSSVRMVAKMGLAKIPIFGHALISGGFIAVDRQNRTKAIKQLDEAKERLREGISIWIAPEGTRTRDGEIRDFKKGGFYLAKDLNTAIVPVFIEGAAAVMPPDSMVVNTNQSITVHFCQPVEISLVESLTIAELLVMVRNIILQKQREVRLQRDIK